MTFRAYINKNFQPATMAVIEQANAIITEYQAQGYSLTLRQIYYQFVARGLIPNAQREYDRLGSIINDGRLAGEIDWDAIEDRTRNVVTPNAWSSPQAILEASAQGYRINPWLDQEVVPEIWVEKEALVGVVEQAAKQWRVQHFACRGYVSQSEQWRAGQRMLRRWEKNNQWTLVVHLGDHDPSGMDMTRDIRDRLALFSPHTFKVTRIALNMDQVEKYDPPPNPAKLTDSRAQGYVQQYGYESWELDALNPQTITDLISKAIAEVVNQEVFDDSMEQEKNERQQLTDLIGKL